MDSNGHPFFFSSSHYINELASSGIFFSFPQMGLAASPLSPYKTGQPEWELPFSSLPPLRVPFLFGIRYENTSPSPLFYLGMGDGARPPLLPLLLNGGRASFLLLSFPLCSSHCPFSLTNKDFSDCSIHSIPPAEP